MGLDLMDVGFRIERAFHIRLDWGDVLRDGQEPTAGDVLTYVLDRLGPNEHPGRLSEALFPRLRATLADLFGTHPDSIESDTALETLLPLHGRRGHWRQLAEALDLPLPALRRPPWMQQLVAFPWAVVAILVPFAPFLIGLLAQNPTVRWLILGLVTGAALRSGILHFLTLPFAVHLPPDCETVGRLIEALLLENYGMLLRRERLWHEEEVWRILQWLLADALGVDAELITPTARLVSDLGAD